jgi:small subunit ribosomal protein S21
MSTEHLFATTRLHFSKTSRFFHAVDRAAFDLTKRGGEKNVAIVVLRPNESQDQLLKRFRKKVVKSGVLSTVRRKRWFISKSELRRVEKKKAIRRMKRRQYSKTVE